jgi:hypothetical protein
MYVCMYVCIYILGSECWYSVNNGTYVEALVEELILRVLCIVTLYCKCTRATDVFENLWVAEYRFRPHPPFLFDQGGGIDEGD